MNARTTTPPVAVAIPCYNEAAALAMVLDEWRVALPDAERIVFDNNSTDGSAAIAETAGATVISVSKQGKGHVVREILRQLANRPAVIMIDGDGTYPASAVGPLLDAVLSGRAEMAVGARQPIAELKAMTPVRSLGNRLIGLAFLLLIGRGTRDLLSGYRVFSPRFCKTVQLRSSGFEVETELASEAVARRMAVVEFPVPYRPRVEGTESKLRAVRDGLRILATMTRQSVRLRPWRPCLLLAVLVAFLGFVSGRGELVGLAMVLLIIAALLRAMRWHGGRWLQRGG